MGGWLLKRWPIVILDDRGGEVRLVDRPKFEKSDFSGRWNRKYIGKHLGHAEDYTVLMRVSAIYGGVLGGTIAMSRPIAEFMLRQWNFEHKWVLVGALTGVLGWPLFPVVQRIARGNRRLMLRDAYLSARHCPACDYDLAELPADSAGLTVCPECGACWQLRRHEKGEGAGGKPLR